MKLTATFNSQEVTLSDRQASVLLSAVLGRQVKMSDLAAWASGRHNAPDLPDTITITIEQPAGR